MSENKKLQYEIHGYSSYSTSYLPENIREDCPSNQTSRWSSNTNSPPQYLTLKLQRPAIVRKIKFGKFEKTHVCNLRKFKVFGGLETQHMVLLFEGGLKNDSIPETLNLRHRTESDELLPVLFIQVMPLLSWGPNFNFSIWYVELLGQDDPIFVRASLHNYNKSREVEIIRLCLKHFRQQGYDKAFEALQNQTNVVLEHPMMSELYESLVVRGDYLKTENFIEQCIEDGLMDSYLARQDYKATWELQETRNSETRPGMRGGHQLIIDETNGIMYLYGGWDGSVDLSDLWSYDVRRNTWTMIHKRSELVDGPTPRSCHKMVFDTCSSQIFTFGRYLDSKSRMKDCVKSDFYLYDTVANTWLQICDDTSQVGGPKLIYDHQMCIDTTKRTIYVFGGRILTPRDPDDLPLDPMYSGLFSYHIATSTWTQILVDCADPSASNPDVLSIKSRVTHSMLFHHPNRKLYIFGGQRRKEYITDVLQFDVDTQEMSVLNSDSNIDVKNAPQAGFAQRATIDSERDEIFVLNSLSKDEELRDLNVIMFWMFSLETNQWTCIYKSDHSSENCYSKAQNSCSEPCPRYAHQLVFDWINKVHYLFGGNPGRNTSSNIRLDDFWVLRLEKPSREQILRRTKYMIRRLEYEETTKRDSLQALTYLRTRLSEIIDHSDDAQVAEFHKLASLLFKSGDIQTEQNRLMTVPLANGHNRAYKGNRKQSYLTSANVNGDETTAVACLSELSSTLYTPQTDEMPWTASQSSAAQFEIKNQRCLLFNKLAELISESMVQPKGNLSDRVLI